MANGQDWVWKRPGFLGMRRLASWWGSWGRSRARGFAGSLLDGIHHEETRGSRRALRSRNVNELRGVESRRSDPWHSDFGPGTRNSHEVKAPRANRPRGLRCMARPAGFEPVAFGFLALQKAYGRRASLPWFPGFTRGWLSGRVHGSAPECTRVHARMDEIWMKCGWGLSGCRRNGMRHPLAHASNSGGITGRAHGGRPRRSRSLPGA
jgi:hypothetical protein